MTTIDELADEYWKHFLDVHPVEAHLFGYHDHAGRFE